MSAPRAPLSTYRLQLRSGFGFHEAQAIVPYLADLGISDVYTSPILKARRNSSHGYDVVDHSRLNPELGTEADFRAFTDVLRDHGMGLLLDIVPNHMGIFDEENAWWHDVLENGPSSPQARCFDIDWRPTKATLANRVLLPVLGEPYGRVLESGEIRLSCELGCFFLSYFEHRYPVAPRAAIPILEDLREKLLPRLGEAQASIFELESILTAPRHLPLRTETDPEKLRERQREKEVARRRLAALLESCAVSHQALDETLAGWNGKAGEPRSFDRLEGLLEDQAYRLCHWRVAADEINYRRFFDINDLAAIRVEDPLVFAAVHDLVFRLLDEGRITGLRIDHPDGLHDPEQYFHDLQARHCGVDDSGRGPPPPTYVVVEKILSPGESLPRSWPVHGTSGYDFLRLVDGALVDSDNAPALRSLHTRFTGVVPDLAEHAREAKKLILGTALASELHMLTRRLERIAERHRSTRDFTFQGLLETLRESIASFGVYRSYIQAHRSEVKPEDRRHVEAALRAARRHNPTTDESLFRFVESVLLCEDPEGIDDEDRQERREFVLRFQQLTGPVTAKGVEDTTFYRVFPLASLNEVGGEPEHIGIRLQELHPILRDRLAHWPDSLSATSTHDTKRSEDVRARIHVLSEIPGEWEEAVWRWRALNERWKTDVDGVLIPDRAEEYLLYQTLVGAWPHQPPDDAGWQDFVGRIEAYMDKALKEAKVHTSWIRPEERHDQAVRRFVRGVLDQVPGNEFPRDIAAFVERIAYPAALNSLSLVLLKVTLPGVPDFYQGSELWDLSLVDPDNRRPVDFSARAARLLALELREAEGRAGHARELMESWKDGAIKLHLTRVAQLCRNEHPDLFRRGEYLPLAAAGSRGRNVLAFARRLAGAWVTALAPRFSAELSLTRAAQPWVGTAVRLPPDAPRLWRDVISGERFEVTTQNPPALDLAAVFRELPLALLVANAGE